MKGENKMANRIYLNTMESTGAQKIGFSGNWERRRRQYITHNPFITFEEYVITYGKTKHQLEVQCHAEIEAMGGTFIIKDGIKTEWFMLDKKISLADLKCCKGRKIHKFKEVA